MGPAIFFGKTIHSETFGSAANGSVAPTLNDNGQQECFRIIDRTGHDAGVVLTLTVLKDDGLAQHFAS